MNNFLNTREEISQATEWLRKYNLMSHPISCKDWELAEVLEYIGDGDFLDMGADGSFILHNLMRQNLGGRKVGIDLAEVTGDNKAEGAEYYKGDLMFTPFKDKSFNFITSCSVLEHQVDFTAFAKEASRLLKDGGELMVSFDYWPEKVNTDGMFLYGLAWNILDRNDVNSLIEICEALALDLTSTVDWETKDAVINKSYCAPFDVAYTFGVLRFRKETKIATL